MRLLAAGALLASLASPAAADTDTARQRLDDAWWTGPLLANSAGALPKGHALIESYVFDVHTPHADGFGSQTYLLYALTDRFTAGLIPNFGYNQASGRPRGGGVGDLSVHLQYSLTAFDAARGTPATAIALEESLPTGKYDRLGSRAADGLGSGAYTTTVSLYSQDYFWLPGGRILRARLDLSQSLSSRADVKDVSVYGTATGFRGRARPGASTYLVNSWEYSLSRSWVLAADFTYRHTGRTRIADDAGPRAASGRSDAFGIAPAIEYSWTPNLGVIFGVRIIPNGHNTHHSTTPALALNAVL